MGTDPIIARHLDHCRNLNLRPSTIYQRGRALTRLFAATGTHPADHDRATLAAWWDTLTSRLTPAARACELAHVHGFYRWALDTGIIADDPSARLARPRIPRRLPRPIPDADLAIALTCAPDRVRPWLLCAAYAGLRACEIAGLRGEDVILAERPVLLVAEEKGGGQSAVPIPPVLADELAQHPRRGWVFPRHDGQPGPNRPWTISGTANRYMHGLGIDHTLHTLRHWYGTQTYQASGRDLRQTQELLRHRSPVSTAGYTWLDPGDAALTVGRLPVLT